MSQFDYRRPGVLSLHEKDSTEARKEAARELAEVERTSSRGFFWFRLGIVAVLLVAAVATCTAKHGAEFYNQMPSWEEVSKIIRTL